MLLSFSLFSGENLNLFYFIKCNFILAPIPVHESRSLGRDTVVAKFAIARLTTWSDANERLRELEVTI